MNTMDPVLVIAFLTFGLGLMLGIWIGQKLLASSMRKILDTQKNDSGDPADWWKHGGDPFENVS